MKKVSKLPFFERKEVEINTISLKVFRDLPFTKKEGGLVAKELFAQRKAMILAMADITEQEFNELSAPDFNTLAEDCLDFSLTPSDELLGKPLKTGRDWEFKLLFPFKNELDEVIDKVEFKVPKVGASEILADLDDEEAEDYMFKCVCGLDADDLHMMAVNDYLALKPRVSDFFQQSGAYFPRKTSRV